MGAIIPSAGSGMMSRHGVAKEKITDVRLILCGYEKLDFSDAFNDEVNRLISEGYQPMPNSYSTNGVCISILMIKTKMEVEMI